jgi:hypothetical protein
MLKLKFLAPFLKDSQIRWRKSDYLSFKVSRVLWNCEFILTFLAFSFFYNQEDSSDFVLECYLQFLKSDSSVYEFFLSICIDARTDHILGMLENVFWIWLKSPRKQLMKSFKGAEMWIPQLGALPLMLLLKRSRSGVQTPYISCFYDN